MSGDDKEDVLSRLKSELGQIPIVLCSAIFALLTGTGIAEVKTECNNKDGLDELLRKVSKPTVTFHRKLRDCRDQYGCSNCAAACGLCTLELHGKRHDHSKMVLEVVRCVWSSSIFASHLIREWLLLHIGPTSVLAHFLDDREREGPNIVLLIQVLAEMNAHEITVQKDIRQKYDMSVREFKLKAFKDREEFHAKRESKDASQKDHADGYGFGLWSLSTQRERKKQAIEAAEKAEAARAADTSKAHQRVFEEETAAKAIAAYARVAVIDVSDTLVSAGASAAVLDVSATLVSAGASAAVLASPATLVSAADAAAEKRAASKKLVTLKKDAGELRNKITKALKKYEGKDLPKFITETASFLYDIMVKIRDCGTPGNETCFNELVKSMQELLQPVNEILSTAGSEIRFNFDLFPAPEAVLAAKLAKEEEDRLAAEERRKIWEERDRLAAERKIQERVGFGENLKSLISPIASVLMLRIMNDCQSPHEAVDGPHAECNASRHYGGNFTVLEGDIDAFLPLFVTDPKNRTYENKLHPFHSERNCYRYVSKPTSLESSKVYCPYCTILLIGGIIIDNQKTSVKTGTHPGWNTYLDMILVYGMQQRVHRRFHYLLMCVYLRSKFQINPRNSYYELETNPINAILGLEQSLQGHFIGALKGRFNQDQIRQEMAKDERLSQAAFMAWRNNPKLKP